MPQYSGALRTIERQRENPYKKLVDAKELSSVLILGDYALTKDNQQFLLYDSREDLPYDPAFFIFCSQSGLNRLITYKEWSSDGTFKSIS